MAVDISLLLVFRMLISELNATKAAARLGVSQAAVSASLRKLRDIYRDPLFQRTQRGLLPTPRALMLQPQIEEALRIIEATLDPVSVNADRVPPVVVVRIGLSDDFEMAFGAAIVAAVTRKLPHVRLVLRQTNSLMATNALNERDIDLALTSGGFTDGRLKHLSLGHSNYMIVYDPAVRQRAEPFTVDEFTSADHILVSFSGLSGITDEVLAEHGLKRRVRVATTHFSALSYLLRGTDNIATIPSHAARALCDLGLFALSPCPLPFPQYAFGVSWRFDAIRDPNVMAVRDLVIEIFGLASTPQSQPEPV